MFLTSMSNCRSVTLRFTLMSFDSFEVFSALQKSRPVFLQMFSVSLLQLT